MQNIKKNWIGVLALVLLGCCENGNGNLVTENRVVDDFDSIRINASADVSITKGYPFEVSVRTDSNFMDELRTRVKNNTLYIDFGNRYECIDPTALIVRIQMPELQSIDLEGTGEITIEDSFENESMRFSVEGTGEIVAERPLIAETLSINLDGTGDVKMEMHVGLLSSTLDGSGNLSYIGTAVEHEINIDGTGDVRAFDLESDRTDIRIDGSGSCRVFAAEELNVSIDGTGNVFYKGNPTVTKEIDGTGAVRDVN